MRNRSLNVFAPTLLLLVFPVLMLSACSSSDSGGTGSAQTATPAATPAPSPTGSASASGSPASASFTVQTANNATLGKTILVNAQGMTLYTFGQDSAGVSNCAGQCATNWPPLTTIGTPTASASVTGTLATIVRSDGTTQVTYNGSPLYGWVRDTNPGDATGDNVNGFHAATP